MAELGAYYITIMPEMSKFTGKVKSALGRSGTEGGNSFSGSFGEVLRGSAIGTAIGNLASKAGDAIMGGLDTGIRRLDTLKNYPKVMESLGYSASDADKSIRLIQDHLDGLPTSTQDMVTLTQAISDSTGDLDLATRAALGFNDMMLANGASAADMATAQGVLNRVLGKGSATVGQWQSLTSVMPSQLNAVAREMLGTSATSQDLYEALNDGTVSWQDFLKAIVKLDQEGSGAMTSFEQQARANSDGIGTAIDNIPNRIGAGWAKILETVGRSDISNAINDLSNGAKNAMYGVADGIGDLKQRLAAADVAGTFRDTAASIQSAFSGIDLSGLLSGVSRGVDNLISHVRPVGETIKGAFDNPAVRSAMQTLADTMGVLADKAGSILGNALQILAGALARVVEAASPVVGVISPIVEALATLVDSGLQWVVDNGDLVASVVTGIAGALAAAKIASTISDVTKNLGDVKVALGLAREAMQGGGGFLGSVLDASTALSGDGGLAGLIGTVGTKLSGLRNAASAAGGGLTGLSSALGLGPWGLLAVGIAAAVAALAYFFTQTEAGRQAWASFTSFLSSTFGPIAESFQSAFRAIGDALLGLFDGIVSGFAPVGDAVTGAFTTIGDAVSTYLVPAFERIAPVVAGAANVIGTLFGAVLQLVAAIISQMIVPVVTFLAGLIGNELANAFTTAANVISAAMQVIAGVIQTVVGVIQAIVGVFVGVFTGDWTMAGEGAQLAMQGMSDVIQGIISALYSAMSGILNSIAILFSTIWNAISGTVTGIWNGMVSGAQSIWGGLTTFFSGLWAGIQGGATTAWNAISGFLSGVWNGMQTAAGTVFNGIKAAITTVWNAISTATSTVWNGIKSFIGPIWDWMQQHPTAVWDTIKSTIGNAWDSIRSKTSDVWNGIKGAVGRVWDWLKDHPTVVWDTIKSTIGNAWDSIRSKTSDIWNGIKSSLSSAWDSIKSTARNKFNQVKDAIVQPFKDAWNAIKDIPGNIARAFGNIHIRLPHIALPHFRVSWFNVGGLVNLPSIGIDWYAKGGIFDRASLIGIGEAGREAALPLNRRSYGEIARGIAREGAGGVTVSGTFYVREEADIDRIADELARRVRRERA